MQRENLEMIKYEIILKYIFLQDSTETQRVKVGQQSVQHHISRFSIDLSSSTEFARLTGNPNFDSGCLMDTRVYTLRCEYIERL